MGWKERTDRAKKLHRPSLKNWARDGLHATFPAYASSLLHPSAHPYSSFRIVGGEAVESSLSLEDAREIALEGEAGRRKEGQRLGCRRSRRDHRYRDDGDALAAGRYGGGVEFPAVLDARVTSPKEFHEEYEARCIPCVIRNIPNGGGAERERREAVGATHGDGDGDDGRAMDDGQEEKKEDAEFPRDGRSRVRSDYRPCPTFRPMAAPLPPAASRRSPNTDRGRPSKTGPSPPSPPPPTSATAPSNAAKTTTAAPSASNSNTSSNTSRPTSTTPPSTSSTPPSTRTNTPNASWKITPSRITSTKISSGWSERNEGPPTDGFWWGRNEAGRPSTSIRWGRRRGTPSSWGSNAGSCSRLTFPRASSRDGGSRCRGRMTRPFITLPPFCLG
mmetsp:Transcript_31760/g.64744  ORF Transcript_31760/g.64744 Transcript_31760/m.64744 type:complete len:389 (+) Transcript_31760:436-1602(+)